jgi:hypothetical protein
MSTCRARSNTNAGAGDAPAPSDDRSLSRSLSISENHGAANESGRKGQSRSTSHLLLRNMGRHSRFKTAIR